MKRSKTTRFHWLVMAAAVAALGVLAGGPLAAAHDQGWTALAPLPTARTMLVTALVNGKIYAIAGLVNGGSVDNVEEYDPARNVWTTKRSIPTRESNPSAAVYGGKIYVFGGWAYGVTGLTQVYDPSADSWILKRPMPTPRVHTASAVLGGKIYVMGGWNWAFTNTVEIYDPGSDTWSTGPSLPAQLIEPGVAVANGKVYLFGGRDSSLTARNSVYAFDPAMGRWEPRRAMPVGRSYGSAVAAGDGKIWVYGGFNNDNTMSPVVYWYDPVADSWGTDQSMLRPQAGFGTAGVILNGTIYVAGGQNTGNPWSRPQGNFVQAWTAAGGGFPTPTPAPIFTPAPTPMPTFTPMPTPTPIVKADQTIAFAPLPDRSYRDPPFTLSATASSGLPVSYAAAGNCTVSGTAVTISGAGACTITASQAGNTYYNPAPPVSQSFAIGKATPVVTWANPADIVYGTALGSRQLNATASVAGSFVYNPAAGTVLNAGPAQTLSVAFTPADAANYNDASANVKINVLKADQTITFGALPDRTYGDDPFNVGATATSGLAVAFAAAGNCSLSDNTVAITGAGACAVTASQAGDANWSPALSVTRNFAIAKATPTLAWADPAGITYGTALGAGQLNATAAFKGAPLAGTFTYTPAVGTVLPPGQDQTLAVVFAPADGANFDGATASVKINVSYRFGGFLPPIGKEAGLRVGNAIPVKFQLLDAGGAPVGTAVATLAANGSPATAQGNSNQGDRFRYDPVDKIYIYNLSTRGLATGRLSLVAKLDDGTSHTAEVILK